jgi:hypothetical protein
MDDDIQIPQWIAMLQENNLGSKEKLLKLILTVNEMRSRLIRVKLPTIMGQLDRLQKDYLDLINQAESQKSAIETKHESNESSTSSIAPPPLDPISTVLGYLSDINEHRKGHMHSLTCLMHLISLPLTLLQYQLSLQMRLFNCVVWPMRTVACPAPIPTISPILTIGSRRGSQFLKRVRRNLNI